MFAPEKFARWMNEYRHTDRRYGHIYLYHSRSDIHSVELCRCILADLVGHSDVIREQGHRGEIAFGINARHKWASTGKSKTLDLVIGRPAEVRVRELGTLQASEIPQAKEFKDIFFACEAKSVMTEHKKSQPRLFDELSSSHEIVHQGDPDAIAAGITVVNIADTFVSPLRQITADEIFVTQHDQPRVTESMVNHLRGLPIRNEIGEVGFDAYCTIVINCDNQTRANLASDPPAPQFGDPDHYDSFLRRIMEGYEARFA